MNSSPSAKVLLDTIVSNLPTDYNLSAIIQTATKENEARASGGSCDVTVGELAWDVLKGNPDLQTRCAQADSRDVMKPMRIAIKQARAHTLNSISEDKREKFITVRSQSILESSPL